MNIDKALREILKDMVNDETLKEKVDTEDNPDFMKDLEFDSVDIMRFVIELEEQFGIRITEESNFIDILTDLRSVRTWLEMRQL